VNDEELKMLGGADKGGPVLAMTMMRRMIIKFFSFSEY
jgi:hypothetical protein